MGADHQPRNYLKPKPEAEFPSRPDCAPSRLSAEIAGMAITGFISTSLIGVGSTGGDSVEVAAMLT